jgi:hypothetical protein
MEMMASAKAPTLMKPTMSGGDAPPVSRAPGWSAFGVEVVVGAEGSVDGADDVTDIADVVLFPRNGPGGGGEDMVHGCREGADCMAQRVGRGRL